MRHTSFLNAIQVPPFVVGCGPGAMGEERKLRLFVEDGPDAGPIIEHALIAASYKVHLALWLGEALSRFQTRSYDIVLTDIMLPDGNGLGIADAASRRGIASLVIAGYAFWMTAEDLVRHEVLLKPVRARELLGAIERRLAGQYRRAFVTASALRPSKQQSGSQRLQKPLCV
jgi:DNA-binding response OmpR family regulator